MSIPEPIPPSAVRRMERPSRPQPHLLLAVHGQQRHHRAHGRAAGAFGEGWRHLGEEEPAVAGVAAAADEARGRRARLPCCCCCCCSCCCCVRLLLLWLFLRLLLPLPLLLLLRLLLPLLDRPT